MDISPLAKSVQDGAVVWRRALHRIPEAGTQEFKTGAYLRAELRALGADRVETLAGTGVRALFLAEGAKDTIGIRADMDALSIAEPEGLPFRSEHEGFMHACGHDAHMALALGAGAMAARLRAQGRLRVNVALLFQPAEESIGGAERMIADGALENPRVSRVYGLHVMPGVPVGKIALSAGPVMASTNEFDIDIEGRAAHGAMPHLGADAVAAAAHIIGLLQAVHARAVDPSERRLVTIGRVTAGDRRNIIARSAHLEGIMRTFSSDADRDVTAAVAAALAATDAAFGTSSRYSVFASYPAVVNPPEETAACAALIGGDAVPQRALLVAEDFSFYQRARPAVFGFLGIGDCPPLHAGGFCLDESALAAGLEYYLRLMSV